MAVSLSVKERRVVTQLVPLFLPDKLAATPDLLRFSPCQGEPTLASSRILYLRCFAQPSGKNRGQVGLVFHYQMLPSSFQLAEAPTYIAWKIFKSSQKLWDQEAASSSHFFINRALAILVGGGGYLEGIIVLPITLASTPVTIVADYDVL